MKSATEAGKITAIGSAEAHVIKQKTDALGSANYATIESVTALARSGISLVPQIVAGGSDRKGGKSSLASALIGSLLAKQVAAEKQSAPAAQPKPSSSALLAAE